MNTIKTITGVTAIVALLGIGAAVRQRDLARKSAATLATVGAERDVLRARLAAQEKRGRDSSQALASAEETIARLRGSDAKPAETPGPRPRVSQGVAMDYVLEHAESHEPFVQQQLLRTQARLDRFFQEAALSAEQQARVLAATKLKIGGDLGLMAALHQLGYGVGTMPSDPQARKEVQALIATAQKEAVASDVDLRSQLGEDLFARMQQYASAVPQRNVADQLASRLYYTESPLTAAQADQLAQILLQNRFAPQPDAGPLNTLAGTFVPPQNFTRRMAQAMQTGGMNLLEWSAPVTDAALESARSILTARQFAALQQLQAQQLVQFQLAPPPEGQPAGGK